MITIIKLILKLAFCNLPLSITVIRLLGVPVNPRLIPWTLNVQFVSVSDSCSSEHVADVSSVTDPEQFPQSDIIRY